jgi:hypothetical protein
METMKVKPWGIGQGDFVLINAEDFDPAVHEPLNGEVAVKASEDVDAPKRRGRQPAAKSEAQG